jgi:hypothetical protein
LNLTKNFLSLFCKVLFKMSRVMPRSEGVTIEKIKNKK